MFGKKKDNNKPQIDAALARIEELERKVAGLEERIALIERSWPSVESLVKAAEEAATPKKPEDFAPKHPFRFGI